MEVAVAEASQRLSVSTDTIRRRIKTGQLKARRETTGQTFHWLVEIDERPTNGTETEALRETIRILETELEARRKEISELHILLNNQRSLEAPRGWLRKLWPF